MNTSNQRYFDKDFLDFFKELAAHNHKDWFDANRRRYEKSVKKPFENFIADLIAEIRAKDPEVQITPREAIFRINRDIRFAKDKSPYKLDRSAIISPGGRKDKSMPGMYLSLGPEKATFGGGAYFLNADQLQRVRQHIADHPQEFANILADPEFKNTFGELLGEANKRIAKELADAAAQQPLIMRKQFYYMHALEPEVITSPELMPVALRHFEVARPMQKFLKQAL